MLTLREIEIWNSWLELLKSRGIPIPSNQKKSILDIWCNEKTRDSQIKLRIPFKIIIIKALDGTLTESDASKDFRNSKHFIVSNLQ